MHRTSSPHILFIPSWYPTADDPLMGFFFQEMCVLVKNAGFQVGVIYPEIRSLKQLSLKLALKNRGQISNNSEEDIPTLRQHGWNLFPKWEKAQMRQWAYSAEKLFSNYVSLYGRPSLLHAHSSLWGGTAAYFLSQKHHIPYAITEHRDNFLHGTALSTPRENCWSTPLLQKVWDHAELPIAVSASLAKALLPFSNKLKQEISVVPVPVDTDFFTPSNNHPDGPFRFFCLSKLVPGKNIDLLINAFTKLVKDHPSAILEIGGFGVEAERLKNLVHKLQMQNNILFSGKLERIEVKQAFERSHAFTLASDYETLGCVFLEALSMGLPLVGTNCGGPSETITSANGLISEIGDLNGLYKNLKTMLKNSQNYSRETLRREAIEKYSQKAVMNSLKKLYQEALQ